VGWHGLSLATIPSSRTRLACAEQKEGAMRTHAWMKAGALAVLVLAVTQLQAQTTYSVLETGVSPSASIEDVRLNSQGQVLFRQTAGTQWLSQRWSPTLGLETVSTQEIPGFSKQFLVSTNESGQRLVLSRAGGVISYSLDAPDGSGIRVPTTNPPVINAEGLSPNAFTLSELRLTDQGAVVGRLGGASILRISVPVEGGGRKEGLGSLPAIWRPGVGVTTILPPTDILGPPQQGPLDYPPSVRSAALGLNAKGQAVGYMGGSVRGATNAILWTAQGTLQELAGLPGHAWNGAWDINDEGVVVGGSTLVNQIDPGTTERAFVWSATAGTKDLNTLLSDADVARGVVVRGAYDINNRGDILALVDGDGSTRWALLSAVPEPASASLMALGLLGAMLATRRARTASTRC
jgi:PEP-CTERM motif